MADQVTNLTKQIEESKNQPLTLGSDLRLTDLRKKLNIAQAERAKQQWYGSNEESGNIQVEKPKTPVISKVMTALTAPLYGAVGAVKKATGMSQGSLMQAINDNITKEQDTFGTVLQKVGVPRIVSAPLGFALDMGVGGIIDPFVGFGAGSRYTSTMRRALAGAKETKTAEGALLGLKSGLLERGAKIAGKTPILKKTEFTKKLGERAIQATENFEEKVGKTIFDIAEENKARNILEGKPQIGANFDDQVKTGFTKWANKNYYEKGKKFLWFDAPETAWDFVFGARHVDWQKERVMLADFKRLGLIEESGKAIKTEEFSRLIQKTGAERLLAASKKVGPGESLLPAMDTAGEAITYADSQALKEMENVANGMKGGGTVEGIFQNIQKYPEHIRDPLLKLQDIFEEGMKTPAMKNEIVTAKGSADIVSRMIDEAETDNVMKEFINLVNDELAKVNKWDPMEQARNYLGKVKVANPDGLKATLADIGIKMTKVNDVLRGHFSTAVTGALNPATFIGSVISNPTMAKAMGLKSWGNELYWKRVFEASKIIRGKSTVDAIDELKKVPEISIFMDTYPELFEKMFGFHPLQLSVSKMVDETVSTMKVSRKDFYDEMLKIAGDEEKLKVELHKMVTGLTGKNKEGKKMLGSFTTMYQKQADKEMAAWKNNFSQRLGRSPNADELPGIDELMKDYQGGLGFSSEFINYGEMGKWKQMVASKAATNGGLWKAYDWYLTKPMEAYDLSDSMFRLGTWMHLIQDGVDASEVSLLSRFIPMGKEGFTDHVIKNGQKYYRMTADNAANVVGDMYMNYATMPGFVKMSRSLPLIGSPFAAFSVGMTGKLMKTLLYNPEGLMKINVAMKELASAETPAEKQALESKYYSWIQNDPMMMKVGRMPFFRDNPVFASMRPINPFVSTIFRPSERTWSDTLEGNVGQMIDSSPLFKTPVGSMLLTTMILPMFMDEDTPVQGYFGQQQFPTDASWLEKVGLATRDVAASFVPSSVGAAAGVATTALPAEYAEGAIKTLPSYTGRGVGYAMRGRGTLGTGSASTMERRAELVTRRLASMLGVSLNPVDLQSVEKLGKKLNTK